MHSLRIHHADFAPAASANWAEAPPFPDPIAVPAQHSISFSMQITPLNCPATEDERGSVLFVQVSNDSRLSRSRELLLERAGLQVCSTFSADALAIDVADVDVAFLLCQTLHPDQAFDLARQLRRARQDASIVRFTHAPVTERVACDRMLQVPVAPRLLIREMIGLEQSIADRRASSC